MIQKVLCIGATLVDELFVCFEKAIPETSNPARYQKSVGGVMCNIAQHLTVLDIDVELITVFGKDSEAIIIKQELNSKGVRFKNSLSVNDRSGKYTSILNPDGSMFAGVCDDNCCKYLNPHFFETKTEIFHNAQLLVCDTNLPLESIQWLITFALKHQKKLIIEPVSIAKAHKLSSISLEGVYMITPNEDELKSIQCDENENNLQHIQKLLERGVKQVWLSRGENGSTLYQKNETIDIQVPNITITDSTGAGDAALAGWIYAFIHHYDDETCIKAGHTLALDVLQIQGAVHSHLTPQIFQQHLIKYYPNGT